MTVLLGVRYEGSSLNMNNVVDSDGDRFLVSEVEGLDSMTPDFEAQQRYVDGAFLGKARYKERELLVKGMAIGNRSVEGSGIRAQDKIRAMFADWQWGQRWLYLDFASPGVAKQARTIPGGELHLPAPHANVAEFEVPLTALDPRLYSQTETTSPVTAGTPSTLNNVGTFPTYVTATLSATATDPFLQVVNSIGTYKLQLGGSIPAGTIVDFLNRQMIHPTLGNINLATTPRTWWFLTPGSNTVTSSGNWSLKHRSAWR